MLRTSTAATVQIPRLPTTGTRLPFYDSIGGPWCQTKGVHHGKKSSAGRGTIRKKTVIRKGKEYTYWEARITTGRDPGTGRQVQRSFTGRTQREVREKMQAAAVAVNTGTYIAPQKMTVGQWMDTWAADYLGGAKPPR